MALQAVEIKRVFNYNGIDLSDPNPAMSVDEVKQFYAMQFPELTNAEAEGPATANNVSKYVFKRAAGSKG